MVKHIFKFVSLAILLMIANACVPESAVQTAVIETQAAWTPIPTQTPYPTLSPPPTHTPFPTHTPLPTHTPFPPPSPTLEPTATPEKKVLFEDSFESDESCFNKGSFSEFGDIFIEDGVLRLDAPPISPGPEFSYTPVWTVCQEEDFSDFVLEVDATTLEGPSNNGYGVLFRGGGAAFHLFLISADGFDCLTYIDLFTLEEFPIIGCWSSIKEIERGKQTNHLKVVAIEDKIEIFVNDELIGHAREDFDFSGLIGFTAISFGEDTAQIAFDNLRITEP